MESIDPISTSKRLLIILLAKQNAKAARNGRDSIFTVIRVSDILQKCEKQNG